MHFTAKYLLPENFIMMVIFKNMIQGLYQNSKLSHPTFSGKNVMDIDTLISKPLPDDF